MYNTALRCPTGTYRLQAHGISLDPRLLPGIELRTKKSFGGTTLANIKSQIKRNRQNEKRRLRNRNFRGAARTAVKDARGALTSGAEGQAAVLAAISALDKAAQKGAIHSRSAARRKGRLMKQLHKGGISGQVPAKSPAKTAAKKSSAKTTSTATKKSSK
jgi:small subunit ribosomal protein S20